MDDSEAGNEKELPVEKSQAIFDPIEAEPQFPGGQQAWLSFLNRFLRVPEDMESGVCKTVLVKFFVGIDGSIDGFEIVQSGGNTLDNEVIRVLKKMPKWKPAIQNRHPVAVSFIQPVTFQAMEE